MTTVKIHKNTKNLLNDTTYDVAVNNLINQVEDYMPLIDVDYSIISTMRLDKSTVDKLDSFRITEGESYENIITRMIIVSQYLNNDSE